MVYVLREVVIFTLLYCCYAWKIKSNETGKIQELKTKCILQCPFQKQTSDLYTDDITCEIDCRIEHCVKGCHLLEAAFEEDCQHLCGVNLKASRVDSALIFCFIGCQRSLMSYFNSVRSQISHLQAPAWMEHTLSATSLNLKWSEPNLVQEDYRLQCCNVDLSKAWQFCHNQTWFTNNQTVYVQNLQPYTKYQFRVAIRLTPNDGYDVYSSASSIIATLPGGLPTSPPNILTVTAVSSSIISVLWEEGQFTNGPIVSYILQVNEHPVGYAAVKDINANNKLHSYMLKNLQAETNYTIVISARNSAGLGPPAVITVRTKPIVDKTKESVNLMVATDHSVYSISAYVHEEPVLVYNTTHVIKGVALHVHRELLFISDSSGSVIVTSSKGLLTPLELPIPATFKPSTLTIDWLSDHLYVLSEVLHPSGSVVYEVARCGLDGSNLIVIISGFIVKPHHVEVDPFNGYLFWVVKGVGLYRLDLIDISKTINKNVSPEVILEDSNLGAFLVNGYSFRILISDDSQGLINAISLDGQETEKFCEEKPMFQNVLSLAFANGSLFWSNGENTSQAVCDFQQNKTGTQNLTNKLFVENTRTILANTWSSQPFPVPANPPTNFQAIFGHDIAKVSWDRPYGLAGQGEGAWSAWSYRLIVENKNRTVLFDFNDIKAHQFTISSLKPGTEYILKVAAYTFSGEGPWSTEFWGKTLQHNASLLWSNSEGLLLSDVTGYRVTKIEPINYIGLEADNHFLISDIDWFEDQVFVTTNKQQVFWYNLTSNTYGRIQDINGVDCISVEWLAKKLYWGGVKNKMIFRSSFTGSEQEILPFIVPAKSLFIDSYNAHLYWSTRNSVEGASLDGTQRYKFYESVNPYLSEIVGLALDIKGSELYWIEKTSVHPRQSALMILNVKRIRRYNDVLIDKFTLINQDVEGGICYIDQHLVWVRNDDKNAMISGLNGKTTALIHSDSLSDLVTCTAVDPSIRISVIDRFVQAMTGNTSEKVNVIPNPVLKSSIRIDGSFDSFSVLWDAVKNVNYGLVSYRVKLKIDNVDMLINTQDTFIMVPHKKAYVPVKIAIQSYTYWATSNAVRITLRSPSSTPSPPTNPRIFVIHKKQSGSQQKEVSVLFRWSPPLEPNGIIQHYELSCWVSNNRTNASGTTCSSSQISAKTLEFALQNLPSNKMYNFQVRACTEYGCGNWSEVLRTNFEEEVSIPILMLTTDEGLKQMDYDRKTLVVANADTKYARDIFYDANHGSIFWIEKHGVYQSVLKQHSSNTKKLTALQEADGIALSYDWVARILYWVETNNQNANIVTFDLNRNEEDLVEKNRILFRRRAIIKNLVALPMNSMLYWVEVEKLEHTFGTLMKGSMDGAMIAKFFNKDVVFTRNDISSTVPQTNEDIELPCNWNITYVGLSITLHPLPRTQNYRLLWYDISLSYITSSDLNGCNCSRIIKVTSGNGPPISMSADYKRVYWLDGEHSTVFSAPLDQSDGAVIEKVSVNTGAHLNKILAYGIQLQFYPETKCLRPQLKPEPLRIIKFSADSMTLQLPSLFKESICEELSLATVEYTIYYGVMNSNGSSNCTINLKSCSQVVTHNNVKKVNKLKPYMKYVFFAGVSNYYSMVEGIEPIVSGPSIHRTAPGVPSAARNLSAVPLTPNAVFLKWSPPEHFNAEMVGYSVLQSITHKDGQNKFEEIKEYIVPKFVNTTMILDELLADQEYIFWVKTFPLVASSPVFSIGYEYSENVTVRTYAEPGNLTVVNATFDSLNISVPRGIDKKRFVFEFYHPDLRRWTSLAKTSNRFVELHGLQPKTSYKIRLKIWYTSFNIPFLWRPEGFIFKTPGTKPSPPGTPVLKQLNDDAYEITWKASINFGYRTLVYWLEGKFEDTNLEEEYGNYSVKYSEWTTYYNGTESFWTTNNLRKDIKYIFRTKAENEYGFSSHSNNSAEYEFQSYTAIVWSVLPMIGIIGISGFLVIVIYFCLRKSAVQKPSTKSFTKSAILSTNKYNCNLELVNLQEIPTASNVVKNNSLYTPQVEECQAADDLTQVSRIKREQISLTKFLGSGAFGEVYEGTVKNLVYANIDTRVAIKALRKNATKQEKIEFLKEASLMSNFKHQHILQLLGVCTDNNPHYIIMELMEGGDLLSYLRLNRSSSATNASLTYEDLLCICYDVASGCRYLEDLHFVHRDLACRNCLVSSKDTGRRVVKIGDFGLARDIYKNDYYRKEGEGLLPVRWMAPESLVDGVFTRHSDIWSFGVLLWEVMTLGQQPYQARSNVEVLQYVRSGGRLNRPTNCPEQLYELMRECWNNQPKERPTFVYCLHELEKLKNSYCEDECLASNYSTYLPPAGSATHDP